MWEVVDLQVMDIELGFGGAVTANEGLGNMAARMDQERIRVRAVRFGVRYMDAMGAGIWQSGGLVRYQLIAFRQWGITVNGNGFQVPARLRIHWAQDMFEGSRGGAGYGIEGVVSVVLVFLLVLLIGTLYTVLERKGLGGLQRRIGPSQCGYWGIVQVGSDGAKLVGKELQPRVGLQVGAVLGVVGGYTGTGIAVVASVHGTGERELVTSLIMLGIGHMGIASSTKGTMSGYGERASRRVLVCTMLAEPVLMVIVIGNGGEAQELSEIQSSIPNVVTSPLNAVILVGAALISQGRIPTDMQEAESELIGGFSNEYSGLGYALYASAEYATIIGVNAITVSQLVGPRTWVSLTIVNVSLFYWSVTARATLPRATMRQLPKYIAGQALPTALLLSL